MEWTWKGTWLINKSFSLTEERIPCLDLAWITVGRGVNRWKPVEQVGSICRSSECSIGEVGSCHEKNTLNVYVPNIRAGGLCLGGKSAPIFFNTMEDSGALPIALEVGDMSMGDVITVHPFAGKVTADGSVITEFELKTNVLLDEVRAGGRIPLIIGRGLTARARAALGGDEAIDDIFNMSTPPSGAKPEGFTLAQKIVGKACGMKDGEGVVPGLSCEPKMTTVGSQDTTGPMRRHSLVSVFLPIL
jgi:aconitase B